MSMSVPDRWLGVEPRHLATFVAVADAGSFRGAATQIGYVQSAVSQQIAQLERALSVRLIERGHGNRDLVLTRAGRLLLGHARQIVDRMRAASADVHMLVKDNVVNIAVESAAASLLPDVAARLAAVRPEAPITVAEVPSASQIELVASGRFDLGLGWFGDLPSGLGCHKICADRWVLVVHPGSSLASVTSLASFSQLHGVRLIEDRSHPVPWSDGHAEIEQVIACDRPAIALDLIRAKVGCALLPLLAVQGQSKDLCLVDVADLLPPRDISVIWHAARRLPSIESVFGHAATDREDGAMAAAA
jgi:DNA-binding transcriptional LysR family regulator